MTDVRPATADLWPAIAELFSAGGDPKTCWCQFWRQPGPAWTAGSVDDKREELRALVTAGRPVPGLVALEGERAVGWVGLGPREAFGRLDRSRTIPQLPGEAVWSVNCFVVHRDARRRGVAGALLEAAVAYAAAHGARIVEGYPVALTGARIPSASVYTGTTGMFERAGFTLASPTTSKVSAGAPRVVMRRPATE